MADYQLDIKSGEIRELTREERKKSKTSYKYVTLSKFEYLKTFNDEKYNIIVPKGFLTDGSTGGPDYGTSWMFHDYLYSTHKFSSGQDCTRKEADNVMVEVLKHERLNLYRRVVIKLTNSITLGWLFRKAWRNSGDRGPEFLEFEK